MTTFIPRYSHISLLKSFNTELPLKPKPYSLRFMQYLGPEPCTEFKKVHKNSHKNRPLPHQNISFPTTLKIEAFGLAHVESFPSSHINSFINSQHIKNKLNNRFKNIISVIYKRQHATIDSIKNSKVQSNTLFTDLLLRNLPLEHRFYKAHNYNFPASKI